MSEPRSNQGELDNFFAYHAPVGDQASRYERIRAAGKVLAEAISDLCPPSADRTVAIRTVREAVYSANASIACDLDLTKYLTSGAK